MSLAHLLFILVLSYSSFATADVLSLKVDNESFKFITHEKFRVSENCQKSSCLALRKVSKVVEKKSDSQWVTQPAAAFCLAHEGEYLTGTYPSGDEDGICRFKDKSFIIAWDFYKRNEAPRKSK